MHLPTMSNNDKAGRKYWDSTERNRAVEMKPFRPAEGLRNSGKRSWHRMFQSIFSSIETKDSKLLELGCGGSALLPYFATEFGFQVFGIDYSENGCELARQMCACNGVSAEIACADFFQVPEYLHEQFDVVTSFGVLEHFTDTAKTLAVFGKFLKPGGLMLTTVPNMGGAVGFAQRVLATDVFDKHVAIDQNQLRSAHESAELRLKSCDYFMFMNFGVVNLGGNPARFKRVAHSLLKAGTMLSWIVEAGVGELSTNRWTSPYLMAIATK